MAGGPLLPLDTESSSSLLLQVAQDWYGHPLNVSVESVSLDDLVSVIDIVEGPRVASSRSVLKAYSTNSIPAFVPVRDGEERHLGVVVEALADGMLILDGVHRALAAKSTGLTGVFATVLRPTARVELPSEPVRLAEIRTAGEALAPKFASFPPSRFRPVGAWIDSWQLRMKEQG